MPKGKIKYSSENRAKEAFAVLMQKERPTRSYTKKEIKAELSDPEVYGDFLKLCVEHDLSETLQEFRKGLLLVLKAIGLTWVADGTGLSRMAIYRMLSKRGNPELRSLVKVLHFIGMRPWVVSYDFIYSGEKFRRYRKELPNEVFVNGGRRIRPR